LYVRFQAATPNRRGIRPGVFALLNRAEQQGLLTAGQVSLKRSAYAWFDANLTDPSAVNPAVYDRERYPLAVAWFKASSHAHLDWADRCAGILAAHGVVCEEVRSPSPGVVIYEDQHQVIALTGAPAPRAGRAEPA
jgi:hypothetical protein